MLLEDCEYPFHSAIAIIITLRSCGHPTENLGLALTERGGFTRYGVTIKSGAETYVIHVGKDETPPKKAAERWERLLRSVPNYDIAKQAVEMLTTRVQADVAPMAPAAEPPV